MAKALPSIMTFCVFHRQSSKYGCFLILDLVAHAFTVATEGLTSVATPVLVLAGDPAKRSAFSQATMPDQLSVKRCPSLEVSCCTAHRPKCQHERQDQRALSRHSADGRRDWEQRRQLRKSQNIGEQGDPHRQWVAQRRNRVRPTSQRTVRCECEGAHRSVIAAGISSSAIRSRQRAGTQMSQPDRTVTPEPTF